MLEIMLTQLKKKSITTSSVVLPESSSYGIVEEELLEQMTVITYMASYEFITFKTEKIDSWKGSITYIVKKEKGRN